MAGQKRSSLLDVDTEEFAAGLQRAVADLGVTSFAQLQRKASNVAVRARQFCPIATGALRSRIGFEAGVTDAGQRYVDVGVMSENQTALPRATQVARMRTAVAAALVMGASAVRAGISATALAGAALPYRASGVEGTDPSEYGIYVEFGTSKMRAQPFLRPALAEEMGAQAGSIAGAGGRSIGPLATRLSAGRVAHQTALAAEHGLRL